MLLKSLYFDGNGQIFGVPENKGNSGRDIPLIEKTAPGTVVVNWRESIAYDYLGLLRGLTGMVDIKPGENILESLQTSARENSDYIYISDVSSSDNGLSVLVYRVFRKGC